MVQPLFTHKGKPSRKGALVFRGGRDDGKAFELPDGVTMIGRGPLNDINLDDQGVSRQHTGILLDERGFWIADLGSRNGTFVNGERIGSEPRLLRNFDKMEIGGMKTTVEWVFMEDTATAKVERQKLA